MIFILILLLHLKNQSFTDYYGKSGRKVMGFFLCGALITFPGRNCKIGYFSCKKENEEVTLPPSPDGSTV